MFSFFLPSHAHPHFFPMQKFLPFILRFVFCLARSIQPPDCVCFLLLTAVKNAHKQTNRRQSRKSLFNVQRCVLRSTISSVCKREATHQFISNDNVDAVGCKMCIDMMAYNRHQKMVEVREKEYVYMRLFFSCAWQLQSDQQQRNNGKTLYIFSITLHRNDGKRARPTPAKFTRILIIETNVLLFSFVRSFVYWSVYFA